MHERTEKRFDRVATTKNWKPLWQNGQEHGIEERFDRMAKDVLALPSVPVVASLNRFLNMSCPFLPSAMATQGLTQLPGNRDTPFRWHMLKNDLPRWWWVHITNRQNQWEQPTEGIKKALWSLIDLGKQSIKRKSSKLSDALHKALKLQGEKPTAQRKQFNHTFSQFTEGTCGWKNPEKGYYKRGSRQLHSRWRWIDIGSTNTRLAKPCLPKSIPLSKPGTP